MKTTLPYPMFEEAEYFSFCVLQFCKPLFSLFFAADQNHLQLKKFLFCIFVKLDLISLVLIEQWASMMTQVAVIYSRSVELTSSTRRVLFCICAVQNYLWIVGQLTNCGSCKVTWIKFWEGRIHRWSVTVVQVTQITGELHGLRYKHSRHFVTLVTHPTKRCGGHDVIERLCSMEQHSYHL